MKLGDVAKILDACVICGKDMLDFEVDSAFGADLMSDMLAFVKPTTLVLTGMMNPHVIRTAEMLDVHCIVCVRGKQPTQEMLDEAEKIGVALLSTEKTLYTCCGLLYAAGLRGCERKEVHDGSV